MSDKTIEDVLRALHTQGITKVEIEYSGGNDEGSFDSPVFYAEDKSVTVDWTKTLDLDEDEDFDDGNFESLIYSDEGRLNQWYSFAGEYSVNGTITINTETGDFDDSADYTTAEYSNESKSGNVFKDKKENIFEKLGVEK
tara:strand:+ start:4247 stop:4666 length:420 start_codon:yes stop_codon:yes gene_type:complete